jgi:glutamate 5-kinase
MAARRIVVKVGTQLLTDVRGGLNLAFIAGLASQVAELRRRGYEVTVVSSGAIGSGMVELGLKKRPTDIADLQAVAAVGQRRLMTHMHEAFEKHNLKVGQVLLTRNDCDDRVRYLNIRNCVGHLHRIGCVPIVNENDTVAVDELRFGDNDQLAAVMCNAVHADALVLLSVVDGLLDMDNGGTRIDLVEDVNAVLGKARQEKSALGSGGMSSKLTAARIVTEAGRVAVIADGRNESVLLRLFAGEKLGTVFAPAKKKLSSRSRWIGLTKRPAGTITVDDGAARAVLTGGKSLLPSGITDASGTFGRGDVVTVRNHAGEEIARGLTNYSVDDTRIIMGSKSSQIEKLLGRPGFSEVIHRDNLVVRPTA